LLVVILCVGLFVAHALEFRVLQDDAYISLRYARNLVRGDGLVFNPGERVEGYSNFSWTLLLALFLYLGAPDVPTATWLGVVFGAGAILVGARLARALEGRWGPITVATAALIAGNSAYAMWTTAGLETALFTFLVTLGLERGLAPGVSPRGRLAAPLILALAAMSRPDGPLVFVLWFLIRAFDTLRPTAEGDTSSRRTLVRDAVLFLAPLVPYGIWKLWYYGDLLPNTYYAKAGFSAMYLSRGLEYAWDYVRAYAVWGLAPLLALLAVVQGGRRSLEAQLAFVWLGYAVYIVVIGGDVLHVHRFWLPILPLGCILVARGASVAGEWLAQRARWNPRRAPWPAAALIVVVLGWSLAGNWRVVQGRRQLENGFVKNMRQTGEWLHDNLPADAKIAITTIGAISYYSDLVVIDMLGLTDREIARFPRMFAGLEDSWREIKYNAESVLRRRPDAILFSTGIRPSSAAEKALYCYQIFYDSYYPLYFRSVPHRVNIQMALALRKDLPPLDLTPFPVRDFRFLDDYCEGHIVQSRDHDYTLAAELFRRAAEEAPFDFFWAREWWGGALYDNGDSLGIEILREVAAKNPYAHVALLRIADAAIRRRDLTEAERYFTKARDINPHDSIPWIGLADVARMKGDYEKARDLAGEALRRWTASASHLTLYGNLSAQFGDYTMAETCFLHALRLEPDFEPAQRSLERLRAILAGGG
jgi:tetratricopeptide (TPR) repeat protein